MEHSKKPFPAEDQVKSLTPNKRRRQGGVSFSLESDSDEDVVAGVWPRWLVVEAEDPENSLLKLDPWAISKGFKGVSTAITNIQEIKGSNGSLCVECPTKRVSDALLSRNGTIFIDRKIRVTPHRSKNFSKGLIFCRRIDGCSDEVILQGLKSQGVVEVKRFGKKSEAKEQSHTYLLTFALPKLPDSVSMGYFKVKVKLYIPSPKRCFKCQRFGHVASRCRNKTTCMHCGQEAHDNKCTQAPSCPNCKGEHGPRSRQCPKYKEEMAISKLKTEKDITYMEARRLYIQATPAPGTSFADVAAKFLKSYASHQTQCGGGIPEDELRRLRGNRWKRTPFVHTSKNTGSTLPSKGSKVPASASHGAGKKKIQSTPGSSSSPDSPESASQASGEKQTSKSASTKPATSVSSETEKQVSKESITQVVLSTPKLCVQKWKASGSKPLRGANPGNSASQGSSAASQKGRGGGQAGQTPRKSPPRLTKAESDPVSTFNLYSSLSDEDMEFHSS